MNGAHEATLRPSGRLALFGKPGPKIEAQTQYLKGRRAAYRNTHSTLRGGVIRVGGDPHKSDILGPRPSSRSCRKAPQGSFGKRRNVLEAAYNRHLASRRLSFDAMRGTV